MLPHYNIKQDGLANQKLRLALVHLGKGKVDHAPPGRRWGAQCSSPSHSQSSRALRPDAQPRENGFMTQCSGHRIKIWG